MPTPKVTTIDAYLSVFPKEIQSVLQQVRATIRQAAPEAAETISYGVPTFTLHGQLVHFAAFKNHIGFYSMPSGTEAFQKELSAYKCGRGSVQFPLGQPMPLALIRKMVKFRVAENKAKAEKSPSAKSKRASKENAEAKRKKSGQNFLDDMSAPARRALQAKGLTTLKKLSNCTEKELLALHGFGKASIPTITKALAAKGLQLKQ